MPIRRKYIDEDVYHAAKRRIAHVLDIFDSVLVCFSGGKDSLAVLNLVEEVYRDFGIKEKVKVVFRDEMRLLELSLRKNGWIQPILVTGERVIIDGFHRATLARTKPELTCGGKVPCVVMRLSEPERMMLTIRINRAKGSHVALKMHDVVSRLHEEYGVSLEEIGRQIGARKDEVELLLMENVFQKKNINEESKYSQAWIPERVRG